RTRKHVILRRRQYYALRRRAGLLVKPFNFDRQLSPIDRREQRKITDLLVALVRATMGYRLAKRPPMHTNERQRRGRLRVLHYLLAHARRPGRETTLAAAGGARSSSA